MFAAGTTGPYPGIAVEREWNNKDPFYDRDLLNYQALHREGALAVGVIVTRGPDLQRLIKRTVVNFKGEEKYGESSTHWHKLVPGVNLGGGGECPLLLEGIEPARIEGVDELLRAQEKFNAADDFKLRWRDHYDSWRDAKPVHEQMIAEANAALSTIEDTNAN